MKLRGGFRTRTKAKEKANGHVQILHVSAGKFVAPMAFSVRSIKRPCVPTVNPKQLSIACESVDNHGDGRSPQVDLVRLAGLFRSRAALQTEVLALRHQLNV